MTTREQSQLQRILRSRSDTLADAWYKAVRGNSLASHTPTETQQLLRELARQAVTLLFTEPFDRPRAEAIGAAFIPLRTSADSFARIQEAVARDLFEGLPADMATTLQPRVAALIGGLAAGFFKHVQATILEQQERIRDAYVRELRRAGRELRLRDAGIESSINAICFCDLNGELTYVNPAFLEMWGYDDEREVIGRNAVDFWGFPGEASAALQAVQETGGWIGELVAQRKDGSSLAVQVSASVVRDRAGRPLQLMGSFVDITRRKEAEEALQLHVERLEILHEVDGAILAAQSLEELAQAALRHMEQLVPCDISSVAVFDFQAGEANLISIRRRGDVTLGLGDSLSLEVLDERQIEALGKGEPLCDEEILSLFRGTPAVKMMRAKGLSSGLVVPLTSRDELIGSLNLAAKNPGAFGPESIAIAQEMADSLAIAIRQARLLASVRRQGEQLRDLMVRLAEVEEAERRRLVRVLHDRVGQNLTAFGLNLNIVRSQVERQGSVQLMLSRIDDSLALLEETSERIRGVMTELRPPVLDDYGLVTALRWYGDQFASRTDIAVTVRSEEPAPQLPAHIETALFRITQEALTNVARHAQATQVTIILSTSEETTHLVISDDGVGFDQPDATDRRRSWGLLTMRERAETVGGRCHIEPGAHQGTKVIVEVPR